MTQRNNLHWGLEDPGGHSLNLSYTYTNNRVTNYGWVYDADGRVLQSNEPETPTAYTYDAGGQLIRSLDDQVDTSRYFDGYGKEGKRSTTKCDIDPLHPEDPCEWGDAEVEYFIRSSVLGGQVVSDVNADGSKYRTYVHAAGEVIAWQNLGGETESVLFRQTDASGMSVKSTQANGTAMQGDGYEGASAELDPMGANAGMVSPYEDPYPPDPCVGCDWLGPREQSNINPNEVQFIMDGTTVTQSVGIAMFGGLANFQTLMGLISLRWNVSSWRVQGPDGFDRTFSPSGFSNWFGGLGERSALFYAMPTFDFSSSIDLTSFSSDIIITPGISKTKPHKLPDCIRNYLIGRWHLNSNAVNSATFTRSDPISLNISVSTNVLGLDIGTTYTHKMNVDGFTWGTNIDFYSNAFDPSNGISALEVGLAGHETSHVAQYLADRTFTANYLLNYFTNLPASALLKSVGELWARGLDGIHDTAYRNIDYERDANKVQTEILEDIDRNGNPCSPWTANGKKYNP